MTLNLAENLTSEILSLRIHYFHKILPILRNTLYIQFISVHISNDLSSSSKISTAACIVLSIPSDKY